MSFALSILLKGSVIIVLAAILARITERSAARATLVWRVAFFAVIALPATSALLPPIELAAIDMPHETFSSSIVRWLPVVWIIGAAIGVARLAADYLSASGIAARGKSVTSGRIATLLNRAVTMSRSEHVPQLRETAELPTAALIGFRNPVILIPVEAGNWSDDEIVAVLCHELEHLRHSDWIAMILERIVVSLLWINPLIHLAFRSSSASREIVADDAVVRSSVSIERYAQRLISVARLENRCAALAFSGRLAGTEARVQALFESRRHRQRVSFRTQLAGAVVVIPILATVAAAQPWRCIPAAIIAIATRCP